ncbi:MAG: branched-chain amino acid ABC transporter permease [Xanthobacteraceae bacterium]
MLIQILNAVQLSMLIFLLAVGLTFIFGIMRVINLAHGALYSLGAYLGVVVVDATGSFLLALIVAPLMVAVVGGLLQIFAIGPLTVRGRNELEIALLTFGLMYISIGVLETLFGKDYLSIALPSALAGSVDILGVSYPLYRLFIIAVGLLTALCISLFIERTIVGAAVRACVDNKPMSESLGMNTDWVLAGVFAVGSGLAALGGVIMAPVLSVFPHMGSSILILSLIVVVIGGMGSLKGSFYGSLIVGLTDTLTQSYLPQLTMFAVYIILVLVMLTRPHGLFGRHAHSL